MSSSRAANPPPDSVNVPALVKASGGIGAVGVLTWIVWTLLTVTIPAIQHDSAEQRKAFEQTMQRTSERDAKIVDTIVDMRRHP